jgi:FkbM family methyltransferase
MIRAFHLLGSLVRSAVDPRYRELRRLRRLPRFEPTSTRLFGQAFRIADADSFLWAFHEIWEREIYRFDCAHPTPLVLDVGANVGVSVLYFKHLFPSCRLAAFEADPAIFRLLSDNVSTFGLKDVTLIQKAVLVEGYGRVPFRPDRADGGRIDRDAAPTDGLPTVETTSLRPWLQQPVALLKLDIEGAEDQVLPEIADLLGNVERVFVEWHSFPGRPQALPRLLGILSDASFRIHLEAPAGTCRPFLDRTGIAGYDGLVNIFARRIREGSR